MHKILRIFIYASAKRESIAVEFFHNFIIETCEKFFKSLAIKVEKCYNKEDIHKKRKKEVLYGQTRGACGRTSGGLYKKS